MQRHDLEFLSVVLGTLLGTRLLRWGGRKEVALMSTQKLKVFYIVKCALYNPS